VKYLIPVFLVFCFLQSCGDSATRVPTSIKNPSGKYLSTQATTFTSNIDPATLTEAQGVSSNFLQADQYVINNSNDLDNINQGVPLTGPFAGQRVLIDDLDIYSYFFIKSRECPDYSEYAGYENGAGSLTIKLNLFTLDNVACPAVVGVNSYRVFKAKKVG
jgi:hypothetical protein